MHNVCEKAFIKIERASFQVHFWTKLKTWGENIYLNRYMKDAKKKGRRTLGTRKVSDFLLEKQTVAYESKICARIMVLFLPVFPFSQGNPAVPPRRHFPNEKTKTEKALLYSPKF